MVEIFHNKKGGNRTKVMNLTVSIYKPMYLRALV